MQNYDRQAFGKALRERRGITSAKDLSKRLGVTHAVYARVERGRIVDEWVIEKVCKELNLSLDDFPAGKAGQQS